MSIRLLARLSASIIALAALIGPAPALAATPSQARAASAAILPAASCTIGHSSSCPIRITFAAGHYSGQAHSSLTGITSTRWFVVHLRANQSVTIWIIGKGATRGNIYFPGGGTTGQPGGRIFDEEAPRTGDYKIRVTESPMGEAWSGRVDVLVVAI